MDQFEFLVFVWPPGEDSRVTAQRLNELGNLGWYGVGVTNRATPAVMAGMGAMAVPEVVVLLQRRITSA